MLFSITTHMHPSFSFPGRGRREACEPQGSLILPDKSKGTPMLEAAPKAPHDELKRHEDDDMEVQPVNGTLSAVFGATMQSAIMESGEDTDDGDEEYYAALEDDNANLVLDEDVDEIIEELEARKRSIPLAPSGRYDKRAALSFNTTLVDGRVSNSSSRASGRHTLGSKVSSGSNMSPASVPGPETHMHFSNTTGSTFSTAWTNDTSGNATSVGTVAANSTHVMLRGGKPVQRQAFNKKKLVLSDDMTRVFHPTQNGHAIIANHILFQMAEDNAKRLGRPLRHTLLES